jgi:hypothetical protein
VGCALRGVRRLPQRRAAVRQTTTRVSLIAWLDAVESPKGPLPPELRHACLTLGRFMIGDGGTGCFPGTRTLAARIGVHRATVSRWLHQLVQLGWLDRELRRRQFGRLGGHYFPALPMAHPDAPILAANGAPERAYSGNDASGAEANGAFEGKIGARDRRIGACSVRQTLTELQQKRGAAPPSPAAAGSAAPKPDTPEDRLQRKAWALLRAGHTDEEIVANLRDEGITPEQVAAWRRLRDRMPHLRNRRRRP